jgi:hypothetical protein
MGNQRTGRGRRHAEAPKTDRGLGRETSGTSEWRAKVARELLDHGWDEYGALYDINFYKQIPLEQAKKELKEMGLDPNDFGLEEEEIEDDFDND